MTKPGMLWGLLDTDAAHHSVPAMTPVRAIRTRGLLHVQFARPERYNALDRATFAALTELLDLERHNPRVLLLSGMGDTFSVGPDIAELAGLRADEAVAYSRLAHGVVSRLERWPQVTVAFLQGYCLGSALELALACDLLVGSPDIRLGLPGLAWAMVPCMGGLRRLSQRLASEEAASRLFLSGDVLESTSAFQRGLLDRTVGNLDQAFALALEMGEYPSSAVHAIRHLRLARLGHEDHEADAVLFAQPFATGECQRRLKLLLTG